MRKKEKIVNENLFKTLLRKRFSELNKKKNYIKPVLEYSDVNQLIENFNINNGIMPDNNAIHKNYSRIPLFDKKLYGEWLAYYNDLICERNWDIWRQFHITIKSELVIFILDGRNTNFFYEKDIELFNKNVIILVNKSDLLEEKDFIQIKNNFPTKKVIFYTTKQYKNEYKIKNILSTEELKKYLTDTKINYIGVIGYPNVGKSSVINTLVCKKKAKVSSTPGKTIFTQIWYSENFKLVDCPGLVFPRHSKSELLQNNVLNVGQTKIKSYEDDVLKNIGYKQILKYFNLYDSFKNDSRYPIKDNFFDHFKNIKKWERVDTMKKIIELRFDGKLKDETEEEIPPNHFWYVNEYINIKKNIQNTGKGNNGNKKKYFLSD